MTAISLMAECKKALPDAQVFVLIDGRYKRIDSVVLSGVDPVVTGLTSVCLDGEEFIPAASDGDAEMVLRGTFGAMLFNLFTEFRGEDADSERLVFSRRNNVVRAMLKAMLKAESR